MFELMTVIEALSKGSSQNRFTLCRLLQRRNTGVSPCPSQHPHTLALHINTYTVDIGFLYLALFTSPWDTNEYLQHV